MKDEIIDNGRICPLCGKTYYEPPALSRTDNKTLICSEIVRLRKLYQALVLTKKNRIKFLIRSTATAIKWKINRI